MTRFMRAAGWALLLGIAVLSLVPPSFRLVTSAPHNVEHLAIFAAAGLAFGLGYRSHYLLQTIGCLAFAGAVEVSQHWVPGRHARLSDFIIDAISACIGVAAAWLIIKAMDRNVRLEGAGAITKTTTAP